MLWGSLKLLLFIIKHAPFKQRKTKENKHKSWRLGIQVGLTVTALLSMKKDKKQELCGQSCKCAQPHSEHREPALQCRAVGLTEVGMSQHCDRVQGSKQVVMMLLKLKGCPQRHIFSCKTTSSNPSWADPLTREQALKFISFEFHFSQTTIANTMGSFPQGRTNGWFEPRSMFAKVDFYTHSLNLLKREDLQSRKGWGMVGSPCSQVEELNQWYSLSECYLTPMMEWNEETHHWLFL